MHTYMNLIWTVVMEIPIASRATQLKIGEKKIEI